GTPTPVVSGHSAVLAARLYRGWEEEGLPAVVQLIDGLDCSEDTGHLKIILVPGISSP
ncbi:hypothetical protein ACJX0J_025842, partial [Zea mays]